MVHNLFLEPRRSSQQRSRRRSESSRGSGSSRQNNLPLDGDCGENAERTLFTNCVSQVQRNLKTAVNSPSLLHILASYYTRVEPIIDGRPFCVTLSFSTFLFHMQMTRISLSDVELYVELVATVLSLLSDDEKLTHPFVKMVVHDRIFGLSSPTCRGSPHCVVLAPPQQYRAFQTMVVSLMQMDVVPMSTIVQFNEKLYGFCTSHSPLVANRALALLIKTTRKVDLVEQAAALRLVLTAKPTRMNVDFILACYERLKRIAIDPVNAPSFVSAMCICCSEIFLRFRSPIRREYVTMYLYPSLRRYDLSALPEETYQYLLFQLLRQCTPGLSASNPYYLCICAILQNSFNNETTGALEIVGLLNTLMPHAAYFLSALAIDSQMAVSMFCKVIIRLCKGVCRAMVGTTPDEVSSSISPSSVYNVLYSLREVVRSCSTSVSARAVEMMKSLRIAMPLAGVELLGKCALEAFEEENLDSVVDPQILCGEIAMVLHHEHLEEAIESSVEFLGEASRQCVDCGEQNSDCYFCPSTQRCHVSEQVSATRLLSTLCECAGSTRLQEKLIQYLQHPSTRINNAVYTLIFYIISHAGSNTTSLFDTLEPYIRGTLLNVNDISTRMSSEERANVLMLHVRLICSMPDRIADDYYDTLLRVFAEATFRNNHDALAFWFLCNILIRRSGKHLELLPTDPLQNNYCIDFPGCAPNRNQSALNAQVVLQLLDKSHRFSAETRKLVGCCVCRLMQDFNMQSPNIVNTLLSSFGFVSSSLDALATFALPLGEESTFWSFFRHQVRSSAPARTALMTALAKSIGRRFRIEKPAMAVTTAGMEETNHLFVAMVFEVMKRSSSIARVVLSMFSNWLLKGGHTPGKFACLLFSCVQMLYVVQSRFEGPFAAEREVETASDRRTYQEIVEKVVRNLQKCSPRLMKLKEVTGRHRGNTVFSQLLRRIERKMQFTVAQSTGEHILLSPDSEEDLVIELPKEPSLSAYTGRAENSRDDSKNHENTREHGSTPNSSSDITVASIGNLGDPENDVFLQDAYGGGEDFDEPDTEVAQQENTSANVVTQNSLQIHNTQVVDNIESNNNGQCRKSSSELPQSELPQSELPQSEVPQESITPERSYGIDKGTTPHERSAGTSPIQVPGEEGIERRLTEGNAWYEPSFSCSSDGNGVSPVGVCNDPPAFANEPPYVFPSSITIHQLAMHQTYDETMRNEMSIMETKGEAGSSTELSPEWYVKQYSSSGGNGMRIQESSSASHHPNAVLATIPISMQVRPNSYSEPHALLPPDPSHMVVAPVHMIPTNKVASSEVTNREIGLSATNYVNDNISSVPLVPLAVEKDEEGAIVDGHDPIPSVSEEVYVGDGGEVKRYRMEARREGFSNRELPPNPPNPSQSMQYLMECQLDEHREEALHDVRAAVGHYYRPSVSLDANVEPSDQGVTPADPFLMGERPTGPGMEWHRRTSLGMSDGFLASPPNRVRIPSGLIEQNNETALKELRQVNWNEEDSSPGKGGLQRRRSRGEGAGRSSSTAWWAELNAVPIPGYAADLEYSMELF